MKEEITSQGVATHHTLERVERGIAYFQGGWWMRQADWHESNRRLEETRRVVLKRNDKTKQVEIDDTIYP